jgi:hypothetical protein
MSVLPMSELKALITGDAGITAIAAHLDALAPDVREREVNALRRSEQARLFEKAADSPPVRLLDFVPAALPDLTPVHHPGRNTVATFTYFQRFEKRFARPAGERARLFGYNSSNAFFITPGYFVAYETAADRHGGAEWKRRGGVVIDYHQVPDAGVPESWPRVVPNSQGLQKLVYHLTRDFMRKVATGVTIGRAAREDEKGDVELDYWFTLVRREPPSIESED